MSFDPKVKYLNSVDKLYKKLLFVKEQKTINFAYFKFCILFGHPVFVLKPGRLPGSGLATAFEWFIQSLINLCRKQTLLSLSLSHTHTHTLSLHTYTCTLSLPFYLSLSHSISHTYSHTRTLLNTCACTPSLSHTNTHCLSLSLSRFSSNSQTPFL